ncbi:uncharacterized protein [Miscanthus floridulus]|uniref:uncharacterized protein n=1 Tax=Miscanthus floridulus TaxID=154761 RepID=UPI00345ADBC9
MVAFHRRRVLLLMARRQRLFDMTPNEPIEGIQMSTIALSDKEILRRGMRDVRASPPPIPKDTERWAVNRVHAEAQKKWKDAEEVKGPCLVLVIDRKRQAEAPALAPHKALKVSTSSPTQGEATEGAMKQAGEEAPTPREAEAHASDEAKAPLVAEATEGEAKAPRAIEGEAKAPRTSEAEATEAGALGASEAEVAGVGAPQAARVKAAEASLGMVEPVGQDAEMGVGQASVPPLV